MNIARSTITFILAGLLLLPTSVAQQPDARQHLEQLIADSSLDRAGMPSWHLHMSFDLFDLKGKQQESGTIEEWRVSTGGYRLVITSPSYNLTLPTTSGQSAIHNREAFLVQTLLDQVVHPIPNYGDYDGLAVSESTQKFNKLEISCLNVSLAATHMDKQTPGFCIQPGLDILRIHLDSGDMMATRNQMVRFGTATTALDNSIGYAGRIAIKGHVDVLEAYHPDATPLPLEMASPDSQLAAIAVMAEHIKAGAKTEKRAQPVYPEMAKASHISGTVVLCAHISKEGKIASLDVVASPDPSLSQAATDAVRQWTYNPFLRNGAPTEVDSIITVNFNLNP